jgi:hypothetical protein
VPPPNHIVVAPGETLIIHDGVYELRYRHTTSGRPIIEAAHQGEQLLTATLQPDHVDIGTSFRWVTSRSGWNASDPHRPLKRRHRAARC